MASGFGMGIASEGAGGYNNIIEQGIMEGGKAVGRAVKAGSLRAKQWLESVQWSESIHWANIVAGGILAGTNAKTGIHRFISGETQDGVGKMVAVLTLGGSQILNSISSGTSEAVRKTAKIINAITDELKDPNLEGIPIQAESEQVSQEIEVNKQVVIVQSASNKDLFVDNAVPQLKTWNIRGYLTSTPANIDAFLIIKPSLIVQKKLLEHYANSRMPIWYKTHDCSFHKVLITHYDFAYDTRALNAVLVNIALTEYKVMEVETTSLAAIQAELA